MNRFSRRDFLMGSLALAGTAAIPTEQTAHAAVRRGIANDKIHIAIIGLNGRGMNHLESYLERNDVEVVGLCDADMAVIERAQAFVTKKNKPKPQGFQDVRKLLEVKDLHAVSIATPNHWHSLGAIWALQQGKHVYVEKPVSHNVHEGRVLSDVAAKTKLICQSGTQSRSAKACRDAVAYIKSGKIGQVKLARGLCYKRRASIGKVGGEQKVPSGVDYDQWLGPAPMKPIMRQRFHYDWHWQWDYGNGDLGNQGIHQMDIARWAIGKDTLPNSVMTVGGRFGYVDDGTTPNTEISFYDYGDVQMVFEVRGLPTPDYKGASIGDIIYGTQGYIVFTSNYGKATAFDNDGKVMMDFTGGGDHFGNFIEAVKSNNSSKLNAPVVEGHLSSALCHLGNISYQLGNSVPFSSKTKAFGDDNEAYETIGRFEEHLVANGIKLEETKYILGPKLKFDPKKEKFVGNKKANEMLFREYRSGYVVPEKA